MEQPIIAVYDANIPYVAELQPVVRAAGGLGGFLLPNLIGGENGDGHVRSWAVLLGLISLMSWALLRLVRPRWEATFLTKTEPTSPIINPQPALSPF